MGVPGPCWMAFDGDPASLASDNICNKKIFDLHSNFLQDAGSRLQIHINLKKKIPAEAVQVLKARINVLIS